MNDREIYLGAPGDVTSDALSAYLDDACGSDKAQRARLDEIFSAAGKVGGFLKNPEENWLPVDLGKEKSGSMIGDYKLLQEIGTGGFGVVYMADQVAPVKRRVAIKIIKPGMDTRQVVARFEAERQALAMMDHPNIARVFDAGATDSGRSFFAMELVRGVPITRFCDEQNIGLRARLALFIEVCGAVQHAHQKGIVHRDLKPSNVMVTMRDGKAVPKVIDFGIAKATQSELTDKTLFTHYEQFVGTPAYMSPEQAQPSELDIDTRSDVYSLGVLLYELLTGTTPFDPDELKRAGQDEIRRKIREEDPPKPSTRLSTIGGAELTALAKHQNATPEKIRLHLRGDLDWIVMKALEKDRARRYETANGLSTDIHRFLSDHPVSAAAPSAFYQFRKYTRRHRVAFTVAAVIGVMFLLGSTISSWLGWNAMKARDELSKALGVADQTTQTLFREKEAVQLRLAEELFAAGQPDLGIAHLIRVGRANPSHPVVAERLISALIYQEFPGTSISLRNGLEGVNVHPNGTFIQNGSKLMSADDGTGMVHVWDMASGDSIRDVLKLDVPIRYSDLFQISADGRHIVLADQDVGEVIVYDTVEAKVLHRLDHHQFGDVTGVCFSPDGESVLTLSSATGAMIWDVRSGKLNTTFSGHETNGGSFTEAAFSPNGQRVITGASDMTAQVWEIANGDRVCSPLVHSDIVRAVQFSPDGRYVVTASSDHTAQLWSVETGLRHGSVLQHSDQVMVASFGPDGTLLATGALDGTARLWDVATGLPIVPPLHHDSPVWALDFNVHGDKLVTSSKDGRIQVWHTGTGDRIGASLRLGEFPTGVRFSPDGEKILAMNFGQETELWTTPVSYPKEQFFRHNPKFKIKHSEGKVRAARFSGDGKRIVTASIRDSVQVWDVETGSPIGNRYGAPGIETIHGNAAISPDGQQIISTSGRVAGSPGYARLWTVGESGEPPRVLAEGDFLHARFNRDGDYVLARSSDEKAYIWEVASGELIFSQSNVRRLYFCRDPGKAWVLLMVGASSVQVWDFLENQPVGPPISHGARITTVDISSQGDRVAIGGLDGRARVWNTTTGVALTPPLRHTGRLVDVEFSPGDKTILFTASADGTAHLWNTTDSIELVPPMRHPKALSKAAFSPDGRSVATIAGDTARVWNVKTGLPVGEPIRHEARLNFLEFSPDSRRLVTAGDDNTARLRELPVVPKPVPEWFFEWAEAIGGKQANDDGTISDISQNVAVARRNEASGRVGHGFYERIAHWFYEDPLERSITPTSSLSTQVYIDLEIGEGTVDGLEEAVQIDPDNVSALLALSEALRRDNQKDPTSLPRAEFYARQALQRQGRGGQAERILAGIQKKRTEVEVSGVLETLVNQVHHWKRGNELGKAWAAARTAAMGRAIRSAQSDTPLAFEDVGIQFDQDSQALLDNDAARPSTVLLPAGSEWRYLDGGREPGARWMAPGFNDSRWPRGKAELGFGDQGDETTVIQKHSSPSTEDSAITFYFRKHFELSGLPIKLDSSTDQYMIRIKCDDGAVVYLNGKECLRVNMPLGAIQSDALASTAVGGAREELFEEYSLDPTLLDSETNVFAIEVHQNSKTSSDVSFDFELIAAPAAPGILADVSEKELDSMLCSQILLSGFRSNLCNSRAPVGGLPLHRAVATAILPRTRKHGCSVPKSNCKCDKVTWRWKLSITI